MAEIKETLLTSNCNIIQKMNDARFMNVEDTVCELKVSHEKTFKAITDIREAIVRLTLIQENQEKAIANEKKALSESIRLQNENINSQNSILEKSMQAQTKLIEAIIIQKTDLEKSKSKGTYELSGKKIIAIAGIVTTIITVIGTVITQLI